MKAAQKSVRCCEECPFLRFRRGDVTVQECRLLDIEILPKTVEGPPIRIDCPLEDLDRNKPWY